MCRFGEATQSARRGAASVGLNAAILVARVLNRQAGKMRTGFRVAAMLIVNCAVAGGSPFPLQIEMRVPTAATVFPSAGHQYMWIPFDANARVPGRLRHRVLTDDSSGEGAVVSTHGSELHVLSPPMRGTGWWASDGPSNLPDNHHRRGVWISNGQLTISRRFATDWILEKKGHGSSGNPNDRRSYYGYGQDVYAVGDGTVVTAKDGQPENIPGFGENFHPAVPVTLETVGGNNIALDLGGGQYAWYFHLQPGSVRVKVGEPVRRGQPLGKIGCSGDARMPHLHFEVTTSATVLAGEGVPYLIDHYRILTQNKTWEPRTEELPLDGMRVDFGR
jgi:Peptidase family M23